MKLVLRRLNRNAEPQASIESGQYTYQLVKAPHCFTLQVILPIITYTHPSINKVPLKSHSDTHSYIVQESLVFLCICDQSYPRKLAFTYLSDLHSEFTTTYPSSQYLSAGCRPYAFVEFDTFIQRTKKTYQDSRATQNLDKLNDELKDVTKVMTKNIEDLLYRGDSLERMGEMSGRLKEDSRKYKRAAVRINWELLLKQVG